VVDALPPGPGFKPVPVERRFQLFVDAVRDYAIYMLDPQGIVSSWNSGAQRFKGYTAAEIIGQHFSRFYTEEDRRAGVPQQAIAIAMAEGKYETEGWRGRQDGSRFWANVVIDPIRDEDGTLFGFAKITRDITEQRQARKALEETREALFQSQKMEAVGQLTGGVAHDFNNLLQAIGGSLEVIERRLAAGRTDVEHHVAAARTAVDRATVLTQRLLAFSRRQPLKPERANLSTLVPGMRDLIQKSVGAEIQVDMTLAEDLWTTWADANQVESALLNLALNARDAMPQGGWLRLDTANVRLSDADVASEPGLEPGDYVRLSVTDTGAGMAPQVLERAFEPFYTTKPIGQGTGLGLSQLYGFVRQSGGCVRIESELGIGTVVTLYLPRHSGMEEAEVPAEPVAPVEPAAPVPVVPMAKSVLVVEDEAIVRMLLVQSLEEEGYTVLEAANGNAALEIVASPKPIDLLATDVGLPGINGRQLAEMARLLRPELGVLYLTGYAFNAAIELQSGMQLLSKPVTMGVFCAKVNEMVQAGQIRAGQIRAG